MAGIGLLMLLVPLVIIMSQGDDEAEAEVVKTPPPVPKESVDTSGDEAEEVETLAIDVQDPELLRLIRAHLEALGGLDRLGESNSLIASGTIRRGTNEIPFTVVRKRPRFWMVSSQLGDKERTDYYNGSQAWRQEQSALSGRKTVSDISGTKLDSIRATADIDDPIVRVVLAESYPGHPEQLDIRLEGGGTFEGNSGYWIIVGDDLGAERRVFLDGESFLIDRMEISYAGRTTAIRYDDYREVDGLMLPFRTTTTNSDTIISTVEVVERYRMGEIVFEAVFTPASQ
ncbi:MAG: hypothetical protein Q7Q73_00460 [Verrucomicrobiota bacterium JB024]|nr:hypothetical protein [Verrucomicrobiota bacterium JB024]